MKSGTRGGLCPTGRLQSMAGWEASGYQVCKLEVHMGCDATANIHSN